MFGGISGVNNVDVTRGPDNTILVKTTEAGFTQRMNSAIEASIETIRRRVDAFGTTEPSIQRQGRNRVLVQVPGISDVERLKKLDRRDRQARVQDGGHRRRRDQAARTKQVPPDDELLYDAANPQIAYVIKDGKCW